MTNQKINISERTFNINWGDMDALGHVNNAQYFEYFQECRIQWLETLNLTLMQESGPVVIHVACTFLKPLVYPATITIRSQLHSLGRTSLKIDHNVFEKDVLVAEGACKVVWVDYKANKSVPIPEIIRELVL